MLCYSTVKSHGQVHHPIIKLADCKTGKEKSPFPLILALGSLSINTGIGPFPHHYWHSDSFKRPFHITIACKTSSPHYWALAFLSTSLSTGIQTPFCSFHITQAFRLPAHYNWHSLLFHITAGIQFPCPHCCWHSVSLSTLQLAFTLPFHITVGTSILAFRLPFPLWY